MPLSLSKLVETFHLVTDAASHFNSLATDAVPTSRIARAVDGFSTLLSNGVAKDIELPLGESVLHANFLAGLALDPSCCQ